MWKFGVRVRECVCPMDSCVSKFILRMLCHGSVSSCVHNNNTTCIHTHTQTHTHRESEREIHSLEYTYKNEHTTDYTSNQVDRKKGN